MPAPASALAVRPPTGLPAVPIVVVEGESKSGRTVATIQLSEAPWVDQFFVAQIGTQAYDDYGADFPKVQLLVHNGSTAGVLEQIEAACAVKAAPGKLNVVVVDDGSDHWTTHKMLAETRQRRNKRTQADLERDPEAEVDPTMDKWNDVKSRWHRMFTAMKNGNVVGIIVVRAGWVSAVDKSGNPVAGQQVYTLEAEKGTKAASSMGVRLLPDHSAHLMYVTSLRVTVPPAGLPLDAGTPGGPIAHAIQMLAPQKGWGDGAQLVSGASNTVRRDSAKTWVVDTVKAMMDITDAQVARQTAGALWTRVWPDRQPAEELSPAEWEHVTTTIPAMIRDALALDGTAPVADPPASDPETVDPNEDKAADASGAAQTACPICGKAAHLGACVSPEGQVSRPARAVVGGRAQRAAGDAGMGPSGEAAQDMLASAPDPDDYQTTPPDLLAEQADPG